MQPEKRFANNKAASIDAASVLNVYSLLFGLLGELAVEAINTTVLLDKALLTGVEGVAVGAGINLDFL